MGHLGRRGHGDALSVISLPWQGLRLLPFAQTGQLDLRWAALRLSFGIGQGGQQHGLQDLVADQSNPGVTNQFAGRALIEVSAELAGVKLPQQKDDDADHYGNSGQKQQEKEAANSKTHIEFLQQALDREQPGSMQADHGSLGTGRVCVRKQKSPTGFWLGF